MVHWHLVHQAYAVAEVDYKIDQMSLLKNTFFNITGQCFFPFTKMEMEVLTYIKNIEKFNLYSFNYCCQENLLKLKVRDMGPKSIHSYKAKNV